MNKSIFDNKYLYLTTNGRGTNRPHRVELCFHYENENVYLLGHKYSEGKFTDWYHNLLKNPHCNIEINNHTFEGEMLSAGDPEREKWIRDMFREKNGEAHYRTWYANTNRIDVQIRVRA